MRARRTRMGSSTGSSTPWQGRGKCPAPFAPAQPRALCYNGSMVPSDAAIYQPRRRIGRREFDFRRQVAVMAIVNRTTHSFFDMGATFALDAAVEAGERAVADGADWLDIGGVPFLNGPDVTEGDELDRVIPLIAELRRRTDAVISV